MLSFKDIEQATNMQAPDLKRTLQALACDKFKLLVKEPKGRDVAETDQFTFNSSFSHRMIKFKVWSLILCFILRLNAPLSCTSQS